MAQHLKPSPNMNMADQERLEPAQLSDEYLHKHTQSPSQKTKLPRWSVKRKQKSSLALACSWIVDHQIHVAVSLLSILYLVHYSLPSLRLHTEKFFYISYYNPRTGTYALGWDDIFFVFYWIIVFTGVRCVAIDHLLTPLAAWSGIRKNKPGLRFAEQAWILIYYICSWCTGMYIMYNSDYWLNLRALWRNWPTREMDGLAKWYYLVQFAFWLQQIVVVNIEERRKDHWQMFTHHLFTCVLIFTSYGYHQSKVGTLILCTMDVVDIIFPLAKILKYLHFQVACDIAFGVFMVTWFATRHVLFDTVWWSIYRHIPQEITFGCYRGSDQNLEGPLPVPDDYDHLTQPFRDPEGLVCWNWNISWVFLALLAGLQCILLVWFGMILKVAYKVVTGQGADDSRSDDEDEDEEEDDDDIPITLETETISRSFPPQQQAPLYLEKEVLSTDASLSFSRPPTRTASRSSPRSASRMKSESGGSSSGVNLRDRKDLLGRIGCEVRIT